MSFSCGIHVWTHAYHACPLCSGISSTTDNSAIRIGLEQEQSGLVLYQKLDLICQLLKDILIELQNTG
jgi:hypothetical protein